MTHDYPTIVTGMPRADVPLPGIHGWLLQGADRQGVFFVLEPGASVPEHSHGPQWGFVLEGELELTVDGRTRRLGPGDGYEIAAGQPHSAVSPGGARVFDLFADPARYRTKD